MNEVSTIVGWVGLIVTAITGGISGIRALVRGPKEDKSLETDIQERVVAMADQWLEKAETRLKETEAQAAAATARAEAAEAEVAKLSPRVTELELNLFSALNTIGLIWPWGLAGGGDPKPVLPAWIYEWLHKQSKGEV